MHSRRSMDRWEAEGEEDVEDARSVTKWRFYEGLAMARWEVARLAGVSLCSVKRIAQEGPVVHVDDAAERAQRQVGRPSGVANFRNAILEISAAAAGSTASLEILRRVREAGHQGGKICTLRAGGLASSEVGQAPGPFRRPSGGVSSQHDFGESKWSSSRAAAGASIFSPRV